MQKKTSITKIAAYNNGNYYVELFSDGTKLKTTMGDNFFAEFPDSVDLKITNYCDNNCGFCYEGSSVEGRHAELDYNFLKTFPSGIEVAIGGGNPFSHPELYKLLKFFKSINVIANITINENHLGKYMNDILKFIDEGLLFGVGVSITNLSDKVINFAKEYGNVVFHFINGCVDCEVLRRVSKGNFKVLILGYKNIGKGREYYSKAVETKMVNLKKDIKDILVKSNSIISFDNLALEQLDIKNVVSEDEWDNHYMGEDGTQSMFVDLVDRKFAKNSITEKRFVLTSDLKQMFKIIN